MKSIGVNLLLLVVIVLLLVATTDFGFLGPHRSVEAQKRAAFADVNRGLKAALRFFKDDCGRFPTQSENLKVLFQAPTDGSLTNWRGPYLDLREVPKDPWGHEYIYRIPSTHGTNDYDLFSIGPDGRSDTVDDIGNWM
jgi:general secretion pathway protein G